MDIPLDDPWLNGIANVVVLGSVAAWIWIIARWRRFGEVLPWRPRRPVAWGAPAAIMAVLLAVLAVTSEIGAGPAPPEPPPPQAAELATNLIAWIVSQIVIAGGFFALIAVAYRATWDDLALPVSITDGLRDVGIGILAGLAALLPVRLVQGFLLWLMGRPDQVSQHPLIETLLEGAGPNAAVMLLAFVSAVVVAPTCEELVYRLLLQGWLEKREDELVGWRRPPTPDGPVPTDDAWAEPSVTTDSVPPPRRGAFELPYGWLPILASSFLFGLAHFGYGPEPIPLFLFALVLGYVFHRTHRILPCIVAHALFNFVSMITLWRIVMHAAE